MEFGSILPEYSALVFDEAHDMEDVATLYFGIQISNYRVDELARDTEITLRMKALKSDETLSRGGRACASAQPTSSTLFPTRDSRASFDNREEFLEGNRGPYGALANALVRLETELSRIKDRPEEVNKLAGRAAELAQSPGDYSGEQERNLVFWWERRGRGVFLEASPIDVSAILRERVFERVETVILTSATLAVSGTFDFLKSRLGIQNAKEKIHPSHFDYPTQALLYTPIHLPDPRQPDFQRQAAEEVIQF